MNNELLAMIYSREQKRVADIDPSLCIKPIEVESLDGEFTFDFSYPANAQDADKLVEGNKVVVRDVDNNFQEYEIIEVELDSDGSKDAKQIYCEHSHYSLGTEDLIKFNLTDNDPYFAVNNVLSNTQWEVGNIEVGGTASTSFHYINPLKALHEIANLYSGELKFRIEITGSTFRRYVDLVERRGSFIGRRFEFGYDLQNVSITTDTSKVKTALYGWGQGEGITEGDAERLDFGSIVWSKDDGDNTDKPLGQKWVGDDEAREKFGRYNTSTGEYEHIFGEYESQAETPEGLIQSTWTALQNTNKPLVNIEATVADLEQVKGFEHERIRVGDTVYVIVKDLSEIEARVLRIQRNRKEPRKTRVELGNFRFTSSDKLREISERSKDLEARRGIWDRANVITSEGKIPNSVLEEPVDSVANQIELGGGTVIGDDDGLFILDKPNINEATGIIRGVSYDGESALVVGKRTHTTDPFEYRVGMTSDGFRIFGDEIVAGTLRADRVRVEGDTNFYWDGNVQYAIDPDNANRQIRWGAYKKDGNGNPVYGIAVTDDGGENWIHEIGFNGIKIGGNGDFSGSISGTPSSEVVDGSNRAKTAIDTDGKVVGEVTGDVSGTVSGTVTGNVTGTIDGVEATVLNDDVFQAKQTANQAVEDASVAQSTADVAESNAQTANNYISEMASNDRISTTEKIRVKYDWNAVNAEKTNIETQAEDYGITTKLENYIIAYNDLAEVVEPVLGNMNEGSDIDGETFETRWSVYFETRQIVLNAIADEAKAVASEAKADAQEAKQDAYNAILEADDAKTTAGSAVQTAEEAKADAETAQNKADDAETKAINAETKAENAETNSENALSELSDISNDNKLVPSEKSTAKKEWETIQDEKNTVLAQADYYNVSTTDYVNAYDNLDTYVSPLLTDMSTTSDIDGNEFRSKFKAYYNAKTALLREVSDLAKDKADQAQLDADTAKQDAYEAHQEALQAIADAEKAQQKADEADAKAQSAQDRADEAKSDAEDALNDLTDIASDGKLTPSEKLSTKKEWDTIEDEYDTIVQQANNYDLSTSNYTNKYNALDTYVSALLSDLTTTSDINGDTFRTRFKEYYNARTNLLKAISDEAKTKAENAQQKADDAGALADNAQSTADEAKGDAQEADAKAQEALDGTVQYRTSGSPDNNLTRTQTPEIVESDNGTRDIRINWGHYTQGERKADMLLLFWTHSSGSPTVDDPSVMLKVNTENDAYYIFEGVNPRQTFSFGIAPARRTEKGIEVGQISSPHNWRDISTSSPNYNGRINGEWSQGIVDGSKKANNAINTDDKIVADVLSRVLPSDNIGTPSSNGLYMARDYMGFYNNGWKTYFRNNGTFAFHGDDNNRIVWDGSNLVIRGRITALSGSSVPYGNVTGSKPPVDADSTRTIIDGGMITTGSVSASPDGTVGGVNAGMKSDGNIRFWAGATKNEAQYGNFFVTQGGTLYSRKAYLESATMGNFNYSSGNAGGKSKYKGATKGVMEESLIVKTKLEEVHGNFTEFVGDKLDVKEISENGERGLSTDNLQMAIQTETGEIAPHEEVVIELNDTSFMPRVEGEVETTIKGNGVAIKNVTDNTQSYKLTAKYLK